MASVDECLREASDCVRQAEQCAEESDQAVFMLMAKSWMRLAVQIDEVHPSPSLADEGEEVAQRGDGAPLQQSIVPEADASKGDGL